MKTNAKSIVAAAIAAALAAGTAVAPALAAPAATEEATVALVAQSVSSDYAIASAIDASPLSWGDIAHVDWDYDSGRNDYVVTLTAQWGDVWTYWVDAESGVAYMYA